MEKVSKTLFPQEPPGIIVEKAMKKNKDKKKKDKKKKRKRSEKEPTKKDEIVEPATKKMKVDAPEVIKPEENCDDSSDGFDKLLVSLKETFDQVRQAPVQEADSVKIVPETIKQPLLFKNDSKQLRFLITSHLDTPGLCKAIIDEGGIILEEKDLEFGKCIRPKTGGIFIGDMTKATKKAITAIIWGFCEWNIEKMNACLKREGSPFDIDSISCTPRRLLFDGISFSFLQGGQNICQFWEDVVRMLGGCTNSSQAADIRILMKGNTGYGYMPEKHITLDDLKDCVFKNHGICCKNYKQVDIVRMQLPHELRSEEAFQKALVNGHQIMKGNFVHALIMNGSEITSYYGKVASFWENIGGVVSVDLDVYERGYNMNFAPANKMNKFKQQYIIKLELIIFSTDDKNEGPEFYGEYVNPGEFIDE